MTNAALPFANAPLEPPAWRSAAIYLLLAVFWLALYQSILPLANWLTYALLGLLAVHGWASRWLSSSMTCPKSCIS